jgi:hypothetical protein
VQLLEGQLEDNFHIERYNALKNYKLEVERQRQLD